MSESRRVAVGRLTSYISINSEWGKENLEICNAFKTQFFTYEQDTAFQITIPLLMTFNEPSPLH